MALTIRGAGLATRRVEYQAAIDSDELPHLESRTLRFEPGKTKVGP